MVPEADDRDPEKGKHPSSEEEADTEKASGPQKAIEIDVYDEEPSGPSVKVRTAKREST